MVDKGDSREMCIAEIAERQHGIVTTRQLLALGFAKSAVAARAERGRLHRVHQGVYAVGHLALGNEGRWMAAVLACGEGAVLSHMSAAALWGMLWPIEGPVDVSVPTQAGRRRRAGIELHRCASLRNGNGNGNGNGHGLTRRRRIPVTTPARTLADLPGAVPDRLVRRARRQAELLRLPLGADHRTDRTRSDLERDFLRLCRRQRLPTPEVNVRVGPFTVDFLWRERRLVVETDGYAYHRGRVAFEDDHDRDLTLRTLGYDVLRLSDTQINAQPGRVAELLAAELRRQ